MEGDRGSGIADRRMPERFYSSCHIPSDYPLSAIPSPFLDRKEVMSERRYSFLTIPYPLSAIAF